MKSRQNAILHSDRTIFSILPEYWQVSKYTALLGELSLSSQKREKNKSKFWMINLCNGGTKDFVVLWEIIHLKIWTHFSIRQTKLFWIKLKHYSHTCSNDHLCKTTTHLRWPMLSPLKQTPIPSLLYKTTSCLTRPGTTFFVSQMKKNPSKKTTKKLYPGKKCGTSIRNNA